MADALHKKISNHWKNRLLFFQSLEIFLLLLAPARADGPFPVFGTNEQTHLHAALACLNMTEKDPGFEKDLGKPVVVLPWIRRLLDDPLSLPGVADRVLALGAAGDPDGLWSAAFDWLEVKQPDEAAGSAGTIVQFKGLDPALADALGHFVQAAGQADALLDQAFEEVSEKDMRYATASYFAGTFNAEDKEEVRAALRQFGLDEKDVELAIREGQAVDPEPASTQFLAIAQKTDVAALLAAGQVFHRAVRELRRRCSKIEAWPDKATSFETPLGVVRIGTTRNDAHSAACLLILDPAGNDAYTDGAGNALPFSGRRLSAIVDLAGADTYSGSGINAPGSAVFGATVLLDASGDDLYKAEFTGQGAAFFGTAWLEDDAGNDVYRAYAHAQGAGYIGLGVLEDKSGNDLYDVGLLGQAYAGVLGVGLLIDRDGNDRYLAGGRDHDYERNDERYVSLAQGCAIGSRPFAGAGLAALIDLAGNDTYSADVYGQGVGYWYGVGMLLDASGHDTYTVYQYGQGSGIHMSLGLLADGAGNDLYTGFILVQGNAHDYGVGELFDLAGDDTYTADHHAQGRALNNGFALLVDSDGTDGYFARQPDQCQGIGNDAGLREYGSLAILMDLGGADRYSCGATNGCRMIRPDYGIVYDEGN